MGDISDTDTGGRIVKEVLDKYGKLDVLVANAAGMSMKPF